MQRISPTELAIPKSGSLLVVDIRDKSNYSEWHIPNSKNIDAYSDIWAGNIDKVRQKFSKLPKDKTIVTVCNAGVTSQKASQVLESMGYETAVLERGMMGWNSLHLPVPVLEHEDLTLLQVVRAGKGCLSYIIASKSSKECVVVDPSQFVDEYITIATKNKWKIIGVIDTHVHADHLSGAEQLRKKLGVPYYVSRKDLNGDVHPLEKRKELSVGGVKIKPIETPGHTDGSISLLVQDKALLTGDTLFLEGVGRPDLARTKEGAERGAHILFRTLKKIKAMEPSIAILPAHFTSFQQPPLMQSLGELLKTNRALGMSSEDGFVAYILDSLPATPPNYEHIKQLNFKLEFLPLEEGEKLEFGPNRCASG